MNILLPIVSNILLVLFILFIALTERKNGLLTIIKTVLFAGAVVGAYFLTPIVLPLISNLPYIGVIDITTKLAFSSVLAILSLFGLLIISLIVGIIRIIVKYNRIKKVKVNKVEINKIKVKKIQSKEKTKAEEKLKKAKNKIIVEKVKLSKGKKIVAAIFGIVISIVAAFVIYLPVKQIIVEVITIKPELQYLETICEYTPFGQLERIVNIDELLK